MKLTPCARSDQRLLQRLHSLRQKLTPDSAYLLSLPQNLRYLSDYSGEAACGVLSQRDFYLITDYRFEQQALQECANLHVICRNREQQTLGQALAAVFQREHISQVYYEDHALSQQSFVALQAANPELSWQVVPDYLQQQRSIKDATEIAALSQAAAIADAALAHCLSALQAGISEAEFALELEYQMRKRGAEAVSFETIVGFGARSALPHCPPGAQRLREGDLIVIDFGAKVAGYGSDMTRSYVLGQASSQQADMYATVSAAQAAALAELRAGADAASVNLAANAVLQASPYAAYASTGLGHGIGLQLHEFPIITPQLNHRLQAGQVITIEPGIYIPGYGGIRLEDDVLITAHGYQLLSHASKQFELR